LQHNSYSTFVRDDALTPPPCLMMLVLEHKRGGGLLKISINSIILQNI
jgi:hypothetical protein